MSSRKEIHARINTKFRGLGREREIVRTKSFCVTGLGKNPFGLWWKRYEELGRAQYCLVVSKTCR